MKEKKDIIIVIPAYNPNEALLSLVKELKQNEYKKIIVVNDGSEKKCIFNKLDKDICILTNSKNLGKGNALKRAFLKCLNSEVMGVITVDADGQHSLQDVNNIYKELKVKRNNLILGTRVFNKKIMPFRSILGNYIMNFFMKLRTKNNIKDTQSGLRGIPINYLKDFVCIKGERFDYELNMLLYCIRNNIKIQQIDIECIYINKNKTSNFRLIKDSIKCVKMLIINDYLNK